MKGDRRALSGIVESNGKFIHSFFLRSSVLFSIGPISVCIPTNSARGFPLYPLQHLLFIDFLMMTILTHVS